MGRDAGIIRWGYMAEKISTHTPAWGVTEVAAGLAGSSDISTHTPAWGVTRNGFPGAFIFLISTHTPAWGVTFVVIRIMRWIIFQLTRPRGA